jgi:16S rRNA (cytosine967-C5)-methyltransferase
MNEFEIGKSILLKLVVDEMPFALVLRKSFKKLDVDPVTRSNITALVGCELRHHYIFDNLINRFIGENIEFEKTVYLRFYLANHLFLRRFNDSELLALAKIDMPMTEVDDLLKFIDSTNEYIPEELDKASPEFLSLRYNTPAWVIRMWQKQYGKGVVFKVLKVNYRQSIASIRINEKEVDIDDFLSRHPDYSKAPVNGMVVYQGRGNAKNLEEFKQNKIFFMKMATKFILDSLELDPIKKVAIYSETPNNIYLELMTRFGKDYNLDLVINHTQSLFETRNVAKEMGYTHLYIYEANYENLLTCISKKVNVFICLPRSSTLDLLRSTPDYFLRVKQEQLDTIIQEEFKCLEECSKYVEVDGELVYMIPTLSRKEAGNLIANFIVKHPNYSLIEEHQFFPFESYDSCMYYARLKKMGENE